MLNFVAMKPKLKVSGITDLQDGRYCAAVGINLLGFPMDRHLEGHLTPEEVKEIAGWLSGPKIIGEFGYATPDEINRSFETAGLDMISLPGDYVRDFAREIKVPKIFRYIETIPNLNEHPLLRSPNSHFMIEEVDGIDDELLEKCIVIAENPDEIWDELKKSGGKPFAFALGDYFKEKAGNIDYEKCDALMEQFAVQTS